MSDARRLPDQLTIAAGTLYAVTSRERGNLETRSAELDALIHDAEAREHRRAAFNARDKACYRLGGAFEPSGGLDLDPVTLTGFLSLGQIALLLLVRHSVDHPELPIVGALAELFRSRAGREVRAHGVWVRWKWLAELYTAETKAFLESEKGSDPQARWRAEKPTANQTYIAAQICLDLQLEPRTFANRGEAFDWIKAQGGNPRFTREPAKPDLSFIVDLLR